MTFIQPKKEMDIPKKNYLLKEYRVYMTYFSVFFLALTYGTNMGWTSPIIKKLNNIDDNPLGRSLTVNESSWLSSIYLLGIIAGSVICGASGKFLGRKTIITIMGIPCVIFCLTMAFTKNVWLYLIARFLTGIPGGAMITVVPMYIGELAKPEIRGRLFVFLHTASHIGSAITYSTAPFMPFEWYHICSAIFPITFLILFPIFAIESPYYIIQTNPRRAEEILKQLREKDDVTKEINRLQMDLKQASNMGLIDILKTRATRKALVITLGLGSLLMLAGNMTITSYTQFIFDEAGGAWSAEVDAIVLAVFQVFTTILSSIVTDRFGRKPLLAISFAAVCISEVVLGLYLVFNDGIDMEGFMKFVPLFSLIVYVAASSFTSIAPFLAAEYFSIEAKHVGLSISMISGGMVAFLVTLSFETVENAIGLGPSFLIFAGFAAFAVIFVLTVTIETKGKSLEQIQDKLGRSKTERIVAKL